MRAEAICSLSCIQLTIVLFIGSLIYRLWEAGWWVNAATSIILGFFFGWEAVKMIRWALNPDFTGGCCQDCTPVGLEEGQLELGQQYRDICGCCSEKEECKQSDTCRCSISELEDGCCTPINQEGNKCCTRALLRQPEDQCLPTESTTGGCCAPNTRPTMVDKCCSPASEVPVKASNVQGNSVSLYFSSRHAHTTPAEVAVNTGCCAGCNTDGKEVK
ncbi:hypothetical protein M378DRAFT_79060 [Amanita muscaria Koide BX008]|uniref:Uncharacterized protein n=1 Tax=Amanita muscaria (strain Koide BX008) TaxID=946122 RepID=A0A0C2SL50_AMAMK|nr:hypothetical protein M378DRAFT_79060 [Amanita muscaria Koide BX008]